MPNTTRFCQLCKKKIPIYFRLDSRFCSDFCRKKDYDIRKGRSKLKSIKECDIAAVNQEGIT